MKFFKILLSFSLFLSLSALAETEYTIQKSDGKNIVVDFAFPEIAQTSIVKGEISFDIIELEGAGMTSAIGAPELPVFTKLFAIPDRAKVVVKSFIPIYKTIQGIYPYPHQDYEYDSPQNTGEWVTDNRYYRQGEFFPDKWVDLGAPAILRDYRVIPVNINPVRVNPVTGDAMVLTSLHLELEFNNAGVQNFEPLPSENIKTHHFDRGVESFDRMYGDLIANYDWVSPNGENLKGSLLIIYPNVNNVFTTLLPLIEWKKRVGYATTAMSVPNASTTATVQAIIDNAYATYEPPLEAVIIVGDAAGAIDIDCYNYSGGASDYPYSLLEGNDILGEIVIGRYSVNSITELSTAVNKVLYYESNPSSTITNWYKKGALASGSGLGSSTIITNRIIKNWWWEDGFAQVDTIWYTMGGSIPTFMTNCFNNGVSVFNFLGYWGISGFTVTNVYNLTNSYKLPFTVFCVDGAGDFGNNGACMSEAWLRAGTPTNPTGGIGSVATATLSSHTQYNCAVSLGIWKGLHNEGLTTLGELTYRGKFEIYLSYQSYPLAISQYFHWNNLMGDPTTDLWTEVPQTLVVDHIDSIPAGSTSFTVTVHDTAGVPLPDRYVTLWKGVETYTGGTTDENGIFTTAIEVPSSGEMYVTVTHHNDRPYLATVPVYTAEVCPSYFSLFIDDDSLGTSQGNADSVANPSETLELAVTLKNYGATAPATNVSAVLSSDDPQVDIITANVTYPNIGVGATAIGNGSFVVDLASEFNNEYLLPFTLTVNSNEGTFMSAFDLQVISGQCAVASTSVSGNTFEPGQTDEFTLTLRNNGGLTLNDITAYLSSTDSQVTVTDSIGGFGDISAGGSGTNSGNTFSVHADQFATYGRMVHFNLRLISTNGLEQQLDFDYQIGPFNSDDPMGPDGYGYYCLDNTDVEYSGHPIYNWIEINPLLGGAGHPLNLPDNGNEQDCSVCFDLPFNFRFYGEDFAQLTVCSNGWLAFGNQSYYNGFCNYAIPSAFGADNGMLCPYWDNLKTQNGGVYCYDDTSNHRLIVEYYRMSFNSGTTGFNTFQVLLYDPLFYPTPTGDGEIEFQYWQFSASSYSTEVTPYWTTGIENHEHTDGILYSYYNRYDPGAAPLQTGRALKFTTIEPVRSPIPQTVSISLEPWLPINIPPEGGTFQWTLTATNTGAQASICDIWIMATLPAGGGAVGPLLLAQNLEFAPAQVMQHNGSQYVPGRAPAGFYNYTAYVGDYPTNTIWEADGFAFSKAGVDNSAGGDWSVALWDDNGQWSMVNSQQPMEYELASAKPNPFNPTTDISYALPEAGKVTLVVYNTLGRQVAVLVDDYRQAGYYMVKFDGNGLSSGIYYYTIKVNDYTRTKKMLLVK